MAMLNLAVALAACCMTLASPVPSGNPGVLKLPLRRHLGDYEQSSASTTQKSDLPEEGLDFIGYRYLLDYEIAGQGITAIIDTGSSNLWTYNNDFKSPGYDPSASSTHKTEGESFANYYGDGSYGVTGTWFQDDVTVAGATVDSYPFGLINYTNFDGFGPWGLFGFGPPEAENLGDDAYPTFVQSLVNQGVVASNAFSMYLSDENDAELLIGGIDTAKYSGPLYTIPLDTKENYGKYFYAVNYKLNGESYTGGLLDTGNPALQLPQSVVDDIASQYGCWWNEDRKEYEVIDLPTSGGLDIEVGGINITIPAKDLFSPSFTANGYQVYWLTITPSGEMEGSPQNSLGDPFLRQLFYVIDSDSETFGFAPVVYTSESNIVPIGASGIPNGQPAPDQSVGGPSYAGEPNSQRATNSQCQLVDSC